MSVRFGDSEHLSASPCRFVLCFNSINTNKSALFPLLKFLIATLFAEDKMRMKLHFQVFFLVYFSSTVAHSQGKKKAGDGNAKSVNLNEVANSQAIVCYDYTGQVSFSCHFEEYKYI